MGQVTVPSSCRMKQLNCPSDWMPQTRFDDEKKAQLFIGYLPDGAEALGRRKSAGRRSMEGRASCGFFGKNGGADQVQITCTPRLANLAAYLAATSAVVMIFRTSSI